MTAATIPRPLRQIPTVAGTAVAVLCLAAIVAVLSAYPLSSRFLGAALAAYAGLLWFWPAAWLIVVPLVLPNLDLMQLTGWELVAEPDLFVCMFDAPLQSSRLSAVFYLICCVGILMLEQGTSRAYLAANHHSRRPTPGS